MNIRNPASLTAEQREAARFRPTGSRRMLLKGCDAVAFLSEGARHSGEKYVRVTMYVGKAVKSCADYSFKTADKAAAWLGKTRTDLIARAESKTARKAARAAIPVALAAGDVLCAVWGYDQTNVDYYQVVRVSGKSAFVRPIASNSFDTGSMQGRCFPSVDVFTGPEKRYLIQNGNAIRIASYAYATKVEPREPVPGVRVYDSKSWSAYA